jgi:hypothetical protein
VFVSLLTQAQPNSYGYNATTTTPTTASSSSSASSSSLSSSPTSTTNHNKKLSISYAHQSPLSTSSTPGASSASASTIVSLPSSSTAITSACSCAVQCSTCPLHSNECGSHMKEMSTSGHELLHSDVTCSSSSLSKKMKMKKKSAADDESSINGCDRVDRLSGSTSHSSQHKKMKNSAPSMDDQCSLSSLSSTDSAIQTTAVSSSTAIINSTSTSVHNGHAVHNNSSNTNKTNVSSTEPVDSAESYLRAIWQQLGVGRNGYLTLTELFVVCEHIQLASIDQDLVEQLFERLDADRDGKISFDELLKQMTSSAECQPSVAHVTTRSAADDSQPSSLEYLYANSGTYTPTNVGLLCATTTTASSVNSSSNQLQSGFLLSSSSSTCSSAGSSPIPPSTNSNCSKYECQLSVASNALSSTALTKVKCNTASSSGSRPNSAAVALAAKLDANENNKENQPNNNRSSIDRNPSNESKFKFDHSGVRKSSNLFARDSQLSECISGASSCDRNSMDTVVTTRNDSSSRHQMCRRASTGSAGAFSPSPTPSNGDDSTQPASLPPLDFDLSSLPPPRLVRRCSLQKGHKQHGAFTNTTPCVDSSNTSSTSGPTSLPIAPMRSHVPLPSELGSTNNGSSNTFTAASRKKMTEDEDFSAQNAFGHFLSLDPFNCG